MQLFNWKNNTHTNILLLGETDVWKSTFINAFVNYLTYETFGESESEPDGLVSIVFTSFMLMDENKKEHLVKIGDEPKVFGQSVT